MFEQEAFLETLDEILDRAQAGQPVWDWQEESAIEALLGPAGEPVASVPSVVELGAVPAPRVSVPDASPAPPEPVTDEPEQIVSLDELAAEIGGEEVAPLELPAGDVPAQRPDADGASSPDAAEPWQAPPAGEAIAAAQQIASAPAADAPVDASAPQQAPAGVGSLEALLRRRGLKPIAQVEEVEVTDRGARS
jgi:hypothetical protein